MNYFKPLPFFLLLLEHANSSADNFTFHGFRSANMSLDGFDVITSDGLLEVTNATSRTEGHAFNPNPVHFKSGSGKTLSFSTTFVFAIVPPAFNVSGHGMAFVISRTTNLSTGFPSQFLGLFNAENNGNSSNHILAIELDTIYNLEFKDINGNHVGIDINSLNSTESHTAGYYDDSTGLFQSLTLSSSQPMQVWVDYDGEKTQLDVTLSPIQRPKPSRQLLSSIVDLSSLMEDSMYLGFSASTGPFHTYHCVLGWSFKLNGAAEALDYTKLPPVPRINTTTTDRGKTNVLAIWLPIASSMVVTVIIGSIVLVVRRRRKFAELLEDWELEYGPQRFSYKDLYRATDGFGEKELLGAGGFGRVYKGILPRSNMEVAIKKVSHESRQGMKQFVAEIVSMGHLRHRNLVRLLGYCRRKGELLLVYDFMPNGSLDRFLYDHTKPTLNWAQRFQIIKGVASGLLYLHEDWEQVVVHRDVKASNVLLDGELNGRLGDFGLARLYDHGTDPQTTHVVGTMGYLAPELARTGKATTETDVFAFGAFLLEVASGKRPIDQHKHGEGEEIMLIDTVLKRWQKGSILEARDPALGDEFSAYEVELVLRLGLLCSSPVPTGRPRMRQVMQFLEGDAPLPELPSSYRSFSTLSLFMNEGFDSYIMSFSSSVANLSGISGNLSGISGGR